MKCEKNYFFWLSQFLPGMWKPFKALFILKIFNFWHDLCGHVGKTTLQILFKISRNKCSQTIDQLIKYNLRNFFLKNHTQNVFAFMVRLTWGLSKYIKLRC